MIVISGANIQKGGPYTIYSAFIKTLSNKYPDQKIIAFINSSVEFPRYNNVKYLRLYFYKIFLNKLFYEYVYYFFYSLGKNIKLWLSLNDCSPYIVSDIQVVYCHNASPFYKYTYNDIIFPTRIFFQSFYYSLFYKINLKANDYIIVQQESFKNLFCKKYNTDSAKVLVNRPNYYQYYCNTDNNTDTSNIFRFIYPTSPSPHKNIEVILRSANILKNKNINNFEIILTISGIENRYIKKLFYRYKDIPQIKWVGFLRSDDLVKYYQNSDALIFSSKLETWGLPISEYKLYNKPIIICNEAYAIETADYYNKIKYFSTNDEINLSQILEEFICLKYIRFDIPLSTPVSCNLHFENFEILLDYVHKKI